MQNFPLACEKLSACRLSRSPTALQLPSINCFSLPIHTRT